MSERIRGSYDNALYKSTYTFGFVVLQIDDRGTLGKLSFREDGRREGYVIGIYGLAISGLVQV